MFPIQRHAQHFPPPSSLGIIIAWPSHNHSYFCALSLFLFSSNRNAACLIKERVQRVRHDNPKYASPVVFKSPLPRVCPRNLFGASRYCLVFNDICQLNRSLFSVLTCEDAKSCPNFCRGVWMMKWTQWRYQSSHYIVVFGIAKMMRFFLVLFQCRRKKKIAP
jgi:hypothetical protein